MDINQLLHDMRNNIEYDKCGITKITREVVNMLADIIEQQENNIKEKQQHLENLQKVNEDMEERIAIMTEHGLWIPVTDRLPQDDEDVLVWVNGTHRDMAYRDEGVWYDEEHNHLKNITHWMPLPEPPKEGEAE